jgi:phenylpropionate dioxygenase-like ring-hydroxylating dioxygenase large terminal subunit
MQNSEKLKNLLIIEIIPDLEEAIDEMFSMIEKAKMASIADKEELQELQEMLAECREIVEEIDAGDMSQDEAEGILLELMEAKTAKEE